MFWPNSFLASNCGITLRMSDSFLCIMLVTVSFIKQITLLKSAIMMLLLVLLRAWTTRALKMTASADLIMVSRAAFTASVARQTLDSGLVEGDRTRAERHRPKGEMRQMEEAKLQARCFPARRALSPARLPAR